MTRTFLFLLFSFGSPLGLFSQTWQKLYEGDDEIVFHKILLDDDSTFLSVATHTAPNSSEAGTIIMRFDQAGEVLDSAFFTDWVCYDLLLPDSGNGDFLLAGTNETVTGDSSLVVKLDADFEVVWKKSYHRHAIVSDIEENPAGGYVIGGFNNSPVGRAFLSKISESGTLTWNNYYESLTNQHILKVLPLPGNEFIVVGRGDNFIGISGEGCFIAKITAAGSVAWMKTYSTGHFPTGENAYQPVGLALDDDGTFTTVFPGNYFPLNNWFGSAALKHDFDGNLLFRIDYSRDDYTKKVTDIFIDDAGNYVTVGSADFGQVDLVPFIEKTAPGGSVIWTKFYNRPGIFHSVAQNLDGGYIAAGALSTINGWDGFLAKLSSEGDFYNFWLKGKVVLDADQDCQADASAPGLPNVALAVAGNHYLNTDTAGFFKMNLDTGAYYLQLIDDFPNMQICIPDTIVQVFASTQSDDVMLPVRSLKDCPLLRVGITQPSLVRCETADFFVSWQNEGNVTVESASLAVGLDEYLEVMGASSPFSQVDQFLKFELGDVPPFSSGTIEVTVELSCDAPAFARHCVQAQLAPVLPKCYTTATDWSGAFLYLTGECTDGTAHFTVYDRLQTGLVIPANYRVFSNGALLDEGLLVVQDDQTVELSYPAQGNTITLEVEQDPSFPVESRPVLSIEGCGEGTSGFASRGFANMYGTDDAEPWKSYACIENSAAPTPNRLLPTRRGLGYYQILEPADKQMEFTLQVGNPVEVPTAISSVEINLPPTILPSSLKVLAASRAAVRSLRSDGTVVLTFPGTADIPPGDSLYLRFSVERQVFDEYFSVHAKAYFEAGASETIEYAFHNLLSDFYPTQVSPATDLPDLHTFGRGNALDFPFGMAQAPSGNLYLLSESYTHGELNGIFLVKTDSLGKGIWQRKIPLAVSFFRFSSLVALPGDDVLLIGGITKPGVPDYVSNTECTIIRVSAAGEVLWVKKWAPQPNWGGFFKGGTVAADGNVVLWGYIHQSSVYSGRNILWKMTPDGEIIWQRVINEVEDYSFEAKLYELPDGRFVLGGRPANYSQDFQFVIVETDSEGNLEKKTQLEVPVANTTPSCYSFAPSPSGTGYLLGCHALEPYFVKINNDHEVTATTKPIGTSFGGNFLVADMVSVANRYYVGGTISTGPDADQKDLAIVRLNVVADNPQFLAFDSNAEDEADQLLFGLHDRIWLSGGTQSVDYVLDLQVLLAQATITDLVSDVREKTPDLDALRIFPNPASGKFSYEISTQFSGSIDWQLFDARGRMALAGRHLAPQSIELEGLPTGIYFFKVNVGEKIFYGKGHREMTVNLFRC